MNSNEKNENKCVMTRTRRILIAPSTNNAAHSCYDDMLLDAQINKNYYLCFFDIF